MKYTEGPWVSGYVTFCLVYSALADVGGFLKGQ